MMNIDFANTSIDFQRPLSSYSKIRDLIGFLIRNRAIFARRKQPGRYVDLGCGPNTRADFCNLDYRWHPGVDVCWDVSRGLPFEDGSVGGLFSEHMLEHIAFPDAMALLKECRRVLLPGRIVRLIVPDGQLYLSEYAKHLAGSTASMPYAEGDKGRYSIVTPMVSINRAFRLHGHQFIWDYETLRLALLSCGFTNVERCAFGQGRDPKLLRDSPSRRIESLYVEAN